MNEEQHLGPGTYSPRMPDNRPTAIINEISKLHGKNVYNGSGQGRFNQWEVMVKNMGSGGPGPGAYVGHDTGKERDKASYSVRFNKNIMF